MANGTYYKQKELPPIRPYLYFGDGNYGVFYGEKRTVGDENADVVKVEFRPSKEMIEIFNIDLTEMNNERGTIIREYPEEKYVILSTNPVNPAHMILCDFEGHDTNLTRMHNILLDKLEHKNRRCKSLKAAVCSLEEKLANKESRIQKSFKEDVKKIMIARKAAGGQNTEYGYGSKDDEEANRTDNLRAIMGGKD